MGRLVEKVTRPVFVEPTKTYQEIGIRSHGKGLFDKEHVTGADLGNKRVFWVEADCLILNIVFAWEQAVGRTTGKDIGKSASHRFPMYKPRAGRSDVDYLTYLFNTPYGKHLLGLASPGGADRNKTLGQSEVLKTVVCVPQIAEQRVIVRILKAWIVLSRS
jgi:type I restriction enzyme S subunit